MRSCASPSSPTAHIAFCTLDEVLRPQILIMRFPVFGIPLAKLVQPPGFLERSRKRGLRRERREAFHGEREPLGRRIPDRERLPIQAVAGLEADLARALALDPDIVFLDEPTSGLDPISAAEFDELVVKLRDTMDLTVYMVTHDLDTLFTACDHVAVLGKKKVLVEGTIDDMLKSEEPWVKSYFRGKRARQLDLAARA